MNIIINTVVKRITTFRQVTIKDLRILCTLFRHLKQSMPTTYLPGLGIPKLLDKQIRVMVTCFMIKAQIFKPN